MNSMQQALLDFLEHKLFVREKIDGDTPLFSSGLIDSFSMVQLIAFLEKTGDTKVPAMDVNLDNLDTVSRILAMMERLCPKAES